MGDLGISFYAILNPQKEDGITRLVTRDQIAGRCQFYLSQNPERIFLDTCLNIVPNEEAAALGYYLLGVLNSAYAFSQLKASSPVVFGRTVDLRVQALKEFRVPYEKSWASTLSRESEKTAGELSAQPSIPEVTAVLRSKEDSIHTAIAAFARKLETLHQARRERVGNFIGWLETASGSPHDSWVSGTKVLDFPNIDLSEIVRILRVNEETVELQPHRRQEDFLSLKRNFDNSIAGIKELDVAIENLETATNFAVYRLYGLTSEDVATLEGGSVEEIERRHAAFGLGSG